MEREEALARELERSGQKHIAEHLSRLDSQARERLARQLATLDFALVRRLSTLARQGAAGKNVGDFEPAPVTRIGRPKDEMAAAREAGEAALSQGTVAAFVVAGGQGSRLQYDGPKGCYEIAPLSAKSLFQIHAEKTLAAARRYKTRIPLYVMTSQANDDAVRAFFQSHNFFGLPPQDLAFCVQRMLPAFDPDGRLLLEQTDRLFTSPDGHGGSYFALASSGALDDMARRGIRHISYFQVDNPLVPVADPLFIGEHIRSGSDMSSKVVAKREPMEGLGVFGFVDGELRVVEYSEMTKRQKEKKLPDGSLKYAFGSIAVHIIDADFARQMASDDLPFHLAKKKIPHLGPDGRRVEPDQPNGIKFERFVFDGVPRARSPLVMEVRREDEFAPVKQFDGSDSPATCRAAMMAQHQRWLRQAGIEIADDRPVEISPLFALGPTELRTKLRQRQLPATGDVYIQ